MNSVPVPAMLHFIRSEMSFNKCIFVIAFSDIRDPSFDKTRRPFSATRCAGRFDVHIDPL
jgi:hypothetical protein